MLSFGVTSPGKTMSSQRLIWVSTHNISSTCYDLIKWKWDYSRFHFDHLKDSEYQEALRSPPWSWVIDLLSCSALVSRSCILLGVSPSAGSAVEAPAELSTPQGQIGQTAHFWSHCLFQRALSWSSLLFWNTHLFWVFFRSTSLCLSSAAIPAWATVQSFLGLFHVVVLFFSPVRLPVLDHF